MCICGTFMTIQFSYDDTVILKHHESSQDLKYPMLHISHFRAKRDYSLGGMLTNFGQAPLIGHSGGSKGQTEMKENEVEITGDCLKYIQISKKIDDIVRR